MKIAIIGRSELLYATCELLVDKGFKISCVATGDGIIKVRSSACSNGMSVIPNLLTSIRQRFK